MHSLTYNGTAFNTYGLIVRLPTLSPTLMRTYDSIQVQDRAWAGKGQAGPGVFTLEVVIVGTSAANCLSRVSTIRGLIDQEEECALAFDMYTDRYWMAKFDSFEGAFTADMVWEGTLVFTCHDRKAYANTPITGTPQTFDYNEANPTWPEDIIAIHVDGSYVYVAGVDYIQKLSLVDLSEISNGGDAVDSYCMTGDNTYLYIGKSNQRVRKFKKSDLSFVSETSSTSNRITLCR